MFVTPQYSKGQVDKAGRVLISPDWAADEFQNAFSIINNWRSSHSFPLNTFQVTLRNKGRRIDDECLVAQRVKRLASISLKLRRFSGLRLSQIQDIGGCRAVVRDVTALRDLQAAYQKSDLKHKMVVCDDYIEKPQISGYRGVHLIYRYFSDKNDTYNGLKIEMQLRSQFQHAWATSVETVGTFIRQALKSSQGEGDWLRFFALMGTAIAKQEDGNGVPGTPNNAGELRNELKKLAKGLDVENRLTTYGNALQTLEEADLGKSHYFLMELNPAAQTISITGYLRNQITDAQDDYLAVEKKIADTGSDAVLVSVDSVAALRRAYPNYFLDTKVFVGLIGDALA